MVALPEADPLKPADARLRIREILEHGDIQYSGHALKEMADDELQTTDCVNVLRGGVVAAPEFIDGTWRYRVSTQRMSVVVAFQSPTKIRVVTAWRTSK